MSFLTGHKRSPYAHLYEILQQEPNRQHVIVVNPDYWLLGMLALTFSFGVSITRVMAEAEGAECKVGIGGRDTRLFIIMIGLLLGRIYEVLIILAILGFITTVHRIVHTLKQLT